MRVLILGGTLFIGRRIARELLARGGDVMVVHRGQTEPAELSGCAHVHAARSALAESPVRSERYPLRDLLPGAGRALRQARRGAALPVARRHCAASLVTVPEDLVPADLEDTRSIAQHFLVDSRKAATVLGWRPSDPAETIPVSVRWHLANPPAGVDEDFSADDRALAAAAGS